MIGKRWSGKNISVKNVIEALWKLYEINSNILIILIIGDFEPVISFNGNQTIDPDFWKSLFCTLFAK